MRFLFILSMFLSLPAFSDVVGTWIYSGSGCRDNSLDPSSHRSKAPGYENPVSEATFIFKSNGKASMDAIFEDGEKQREVGSYNLRGNQIIIPEWGEAEIRLIEDRIVIRDISVEGEDSVCRDREVFVFVLSNLD